MKYRTIFLEFLSNFREYHYDSVQLVLFDGNHDRNILKVISDNNLVDIYQVKGVQVFNKKVSFSSLNNTIVNLLFVVDKPSIIEISKVDDDLKNLK